jgi:hypothetical protein
MSSNAVRTDNPQDASPQRPGRRPEQPLLDLLQHLKRAPSWQMALALALVAIALFGLCRVSGLWVRLRPSPTPTGTSAPLATRTLLPTWTVTGTSMPTPAPSATMTSTVVPVVKPGVSVVVSGTGAQQLRVRSGPGLTYATLSTMADGSRLRVLDGPEAADGYQWWKVQAEDGQEGWVAGDWLSPVAP